MALSLDGNAAPILDQNNLSVVLHFGRVAHRVAAESTDRQTMDRFDRCFVDAICSVRYRKSWRSNRWLRRHPARRFLCCRSWLSCLFSGIQLLIGVSGLRVIACAYPLDEV